MEALKQLSPAETYLIRYHNRAILKDLMKYTLADLCYRSVLRIEEREHQPHPSDPVQVTKYVVAGEQLSTCRPKAHEAVFLSPFQEQADLEITIKQLVKIAYQSVRSRKRFIFDFLFQQDLIKTKFKQGFWPRFLGSTTLTASGRNYRSQIDGMLRQLERELPDMMVHDKTRAKEILATIGGNVLLITTLDFQLLKDFDQALKKKLDTASNDGDWWLLDSFWIGGDDGGDFDSAFDGASGGDAGDSGDSGCSGCSGCGGCGGCGG
ncbi:MAG: hypothetical protein AAGA85_28120 [Bacteroidota bacterium]